MRDGLAGDLADRLLDDIATETASLDELVPPVPAARRHPSFHHWRRSGHTSVARTVG